MWRTTSLVLAATCVMGLGRDVQAEQANWSIRIMREKWTGFSGKVSQDGELIELPSLLWEIKDAEDPEGTDVLPAPILPFSGKRDAYQREPYPLTIRDPVVVRVRGKSIDFERAPRKSQLRPSDWDGNYLSYDLQGDVPRVRLTAKPGPNSNWRVVEAEEKLKKSAGEYQYRVERHVRFRLEAVGRPGWFLETDAEQRLVLVREKAKERRLEVEIETHYDDLNDGK
ncbi:MAG: hypothetical protein JSS02_15770 [Planctomycetes bacterium]|nr:hypothetical protein [Planctomycetota bacterium]